MLESVKAREERLQRMEMERDVLGGRINNAKLFVASDAFRRLDDTEQSLLVAQIMAMDTYKIILSLRLDRATPKG